MRVLIVEDEPLIAMSLAAELTHAGHEVIGPSGDASEALYLAPQADLALIDADLRGQGNGIDLARTLYADCEVPSLLLTMNPAAMDQDEAALGIITLPFDPADIPESIHVAEVLMRGERPPPAPQSLRLL